MVAQEDWAGMDARQRHECEVRGRLLVLHPGWVAARRSAALLYDLPFLGSPPPRPQLLRDPRGAGRSSSRHERLATLVKLDTAYQRGILLTSRERTVVDLAREESFRSAVVVADAAVRQGVARGSLQSVARRCAGWPGGLQAVAVAGFADGRSESPLESVSRVALHEGGVPPPELQVEIYLGAVLLARVDKLWRHANLVGEDDGRSKYSTVADLYAEKLREELLESVGLHVVRWDWATAWHPDGRLVARVQRGLELGRHSVLDPRVRFVTATAAGSGALAARA